MSSEKNISRFLSYISSSEDLLMRRLYDNLVKYNMEKVQDTILVKKYIPELNTINKNILLKKRCILERTLVPYDFVKQIRNLFPEIRDISMPIGFKCNFGYPNRYFHINFSSALREIRKEERIPFSYPDTYLPVILIDHILFCECYVMIPYFLLKSSGRRKRKLVKLTS